VKDKLGPSYRARRRKRYALQGSRWRTKNIRYKIESWPTSIPDKALVRKAIQQSFKVWEEASALTFTEVGQYDKAQIVIKFARGDHGDGDPFDGRGGTLAHAYFPLYGGDAHFDDAERWSAGGRSGRGTDIFMTASHEFGHSLGLSHSDDQTSLMAPFYKQPGLFGDTDVLTEDDRLGIQALYGLPRGQEDTSTGPRLRPATTSGEDRTLCRAGDVDAMFTAGSQKQTYVFRGSQYWRLTESGVEKGYPRPIRQYWDGVPDNIDAAFSWTENERIYFFKGRYYWRMTKFKMDPGYPKLISSGFRGIPDDVDAAFQWIGNGKLYFFKAGHYWKFDPSRAQPVSSSYPQPISNWGDIPSNLDSVLTYSNGRSYFFKKGFYYRFDDARFRVDDADPPYPRPAGYWWFGCKSQSSSLTTSSSKRQSPPVDNPDAEMGFGDDTALPQSSRGAAPRSSEVNRGHLTALLLVLGLLQALTV